MGAGSFRFERFSLDVDDRQLRLGGEPVEVNGRYFDALALLVRERGRLVVPVGGQHGQRLEVIVRSPEGPAVARSVPCRFVPLVGAEGF